MIKPVKLSLYIFSLAISVFVAKVDALVVVSIGNQPVVFQQPPRMSEVLEHVKDKATMYWPGAQLFALQLPEIEQQRLEFLASLNGFTQALDENSEQRSQLLVLKKAVEGWAIASLVDTVIDFDLARTVERFNPRFEAGSYLLHVRARKESYLLTGLVEQEVQLPVNSQQCLGERLQQLRTFSLANRDYVTIVQPDGKVFQYGIAYWNLQCQQVMPGSQIIFMLKDSFFSSHEERLNQQLSSLARNRIIN